MQVYWTTQFLALILCAFFQEMAGTAGAVLIAVGLVGGGLAGFYIDKTKKFEETAKFAYAFAAMSCCLLVIVSRNLEFSLEVSIKMFLPSFLFVSICNCLVFL